jgi:hypothetical protein
VSRWPAPGSVWLRVNARGQTESVWLTRESAEQAKEDPDGPYILECWAVHGEDGKPIDARTEPEAAT